MKKKIAFLLTAIILITYFFSVNVFADTKSAKTLTDPGDLSIPSTNPDNFNSTWYNGTATTEGEEENKNASIEPGGKTHYTPLRIVARMLLVLAQITNKMLALFTGSEDGTFTIRNTLINKYELFNIKSLISSDSESQTLIGDMTTQIATWFVGIRNLSLVMIAIIFIYIGIRLALATVADEKAEYKKMLMGWVEGLILLVLLHYIIIVFIFLSDWLVSKLTSFLTTDETTVKLEEYILENSSECIYKSSSKWGWLLYGGFYCMLVFSQLQIFIFYMGRLLKVAFLIIISPLVCVTYSIDKIKDGKAQAFGNWIKEFAIAVLAQPLQLLIYLLFIDSAGEILRKNMLFAIVFFMLIPYGTRIFKSVLKFGENSNDFEDVGKSLNELNEMFK